MRVLRPAVRHSRPNGRALRAALLLPLLLGATLSMRVRAGEGIVLLPAQASAQDTLGHAAAISGDTAVVGAPGDDELGSSSGSVSVFVRSGVDWVLQQTLLPDDGVAGSVFGSAVDIDGDTIVVGATEAGFFGTGAAYVFVFEGLVWTQQDKLLPGTPSGLSNFGATASIDGDTVVVGAPHPQNLFPAEGEAYVYVRSGTSWSQQQRLLADDGAVGEWFGTSVSVSGDSVAVGASKDDPHGTDSGSAYVFVRVGTTWSQQDKIFPGDGFGLDRFGASVSIDGETLAVGAWGDDDLGSGSGSAYVFTRSGTSWSQQDKLFAPDASAGDFFGGSTSLDGDTLVVGANIGDGGATDSGSAYVFDRVGSVWGLVTELVEAATVADASYGYSVGLDADRVVVGAKLHDDGASQTGGAWVFENVGSPWADLGGGTTGIAGPPLLTLSGPLTPSSFVTLDLVDGAPLALALVFVSFTSTPTSFLGGTLHTFPFDELVVIGTDGAGEIHGSVVFPGAASGQGLWFQVGIQDLSVAIHGASLSNGVKGTVP